MLAGGLLMVAAACLTIYNLHEDSVAASASSKVLQSLVEERNKNMTSATDSDLPTGISGEIDEENTIDPDTPMPTILVDGTAYIGTILIPALGLELPVADDWDYTQMKISPCRYSGSAYRGDMVVCAHNYTSHFGPIRHLQPGDEVIFVDALGREFHYKVEKVETLGPFGVHEMVASEWELSLFTCTLGGKARVTVRCSRTEE